jgi:adenine C2-methylase RlmN of 23S rRNA A2503 and tRNA A37
VIGLPFEVPEEKRMRDFLETIEDENVPVTLRQSKGCDIQAACGQLAGRINK